MMPMVFWASLPPCPNAYNEAEQNCARRKKRSTPNGVNRMNIQDTSSIRISEVKQPSPGASTMPDPVLMTPLHTPAAEPALAIPAPTSPPISACELDDGMPS